MELFFSTFFTVYLLVFQQQNVSHGHYKMAILTSFAISFSQFFMIRSVATGHWVGVFTMGVAGATAVTLSMITHRMWFKKQGSHD